MVHLRDFSALLLTLLLLLLLQTVAVHTRFSALLHSYTMMHPCIASMRARASKLAQHY
jgi:hypothetical protein